MLQVNKFYGVKHSKSYRPSVISKFLMDVDDDGNIQQVHSDVYLLLRQKKLSQTIGSDAIRNYIDSLYVGSHASLTTDFSDEELFDCIVPKEINNITDAHKYAQYLKAHSDDVKTKFNELRNKRKQYHDEISVRYKNVNKEKD